MSPKRRPPTSCAHFLFRNDVDPSSQELSDALAHRRSDGSALM